MESYYSSPGDVSSNHSTTLDSACDSTISQIICFIGLTHRQFYPLLILELDSSTSGYTSFDKARAEGAAITEAEIKDDASICKARLRSQHLQNPDLGSPRSDQTDYATPKDMKAPKHSAWNGGKPLQSSLRDFRERPCLQGMDGWAEVPPSINKMERVRFKRGAVSHPRVPIPALGAYPSSVGALQTLEPGFLWLS